MPTQHQSKPTSPRLNRGWLLRVALQAAVLLATLIGGIALLGVAQRVGWLSAAHAPPAAEAAPSGPVEYTCPMHPEIRQDTPGKCPICGMTLVEVAGKPAEAAANDTSGDRPPPGEERYICPMMCTPPQGVPGKCPVCEMDLVRADAGAGGGDRSVVIDAVARRIAGIRTATATRERVQRSIRTVGEIAYDQERVATISAYVDGRIEEMFAEYEGVVVAKGDDLAVLYSPELYSAQVELLASQQTPALDSLGGGERLSEIAIDNLRELGMTPQQIDRLLTTKEPQKRLRVASPLGGTVTERLKVEGDYVKTGEPIYRVADLSSVWLMLDLFPSDAAAVRFGQEVQAEVKSLPGEVYTGRVAFIDPMVDPTTRTVAVRVEMSNSDGRLKPGDYATAKISAPAVPGEVVYDPALAGKWIAPMHPQIVRSEAGECPICGRALVPTARYGYAGKPLAGDGQLVVPRSAVLTAGDNSVVYAETAPGEFELREVTVAALTGSQAVVLEGLSEGETVATDGAFLIDSQMQLAGKPSLLDPTRGEKSEAAGGAAGATQEAPHAH
ncbi:efflux RND transporter periplasmic adaptor subunit [Botrimarina sp.]|uniref:efflux RND transporter periplasmic adaptor subunit n=1 Tax=Botrimarina sp. TaxID=2795802 RepID=UPI0032EF3F9F